MRRILITGANSYIGVSFEQYLKQWPEDYRVDTLDVIGDAWKTADLTGYDAVYHVAGIAHRKETEENAALYYQVNRDLAVELAKKAKTDGVGHFIFMSSMSVYGMDHGIVTPDTEPKPNSNYGKSKLEAELALAELADDGFRIAVLRPPMVYGKGCRGNFQTMLRLVAKSPVFPAVNNQRSMISIGNLCSFVKMAVDHGWFGVFCPQNREYVNTTHMAKIMAGALGRRVWFSRMAGTAVEMLIPVFGVARKAFSTLIYKNWEAHDFCYCIETTDASLRDSV